MAFVIRFTESGKAERHYLFESKISTCAQEKHTLLYNP
ncbi:hypothetical protein SynA1524_01050 [Synechococcus sp. A15-24]|nr:hypothetical protein SynA1524_01050 [Synechococcus sp. A15-24]